MLLLDEPLGALDLKLRKQMQVELKRIQQEVGITFIYVTHDQEEAMTMSDRIAVMNKGKYEQLGDPETLYERPTTRFVAGFLGREQPARRDLPGHGPGARRDRAPRRDDRVRAGPGGLRARRRSTSACGPRRSASTTTTRRRRTGTTTWAAPIVDASYLGVSTQYLVETSSGSRVMVYEQNIAAHHARPAVGPG